FDVRRVNNACWSVVVADVSGKGVGSALLASLFQGALIAATQDPESLSGQMERLNHFLLDRTGGEKYATAFYSLIGATGRFSYVNAAHCAPLVVRNGGRMEQLGATSMPVGLVDGAEFPGAETQLAPGEKVVIYSDGVTEAQNRAGDFFGRKRLREIV